MRGLIKILCCILFIGSVQKVLGGNSVSHTISIRVVHPNSFTIEQIDSSSLMINTNYMENRDMSSEGLSRHLKWKTDHHNKKITVAARKSSSETKLQVKVVRYEGGDVEQMIPIANCDRDFISSTSHSQGGCDLMYSVVNSNDFNSHQGLHEVVYTITDVY